MSLSVFEIRLVKVLFCVLVCTVFITILSPRSASAQTAAEIDKGINCMFESFGSGASVTAEQAASRCVEILNKMASYRCKDDGGNWITVKDWRYCVNCEPRYCKGCCEEMTAPDSNIRKSCMSMCTTAVKIQ